MFGAVEFNKLSIVTGIVKIALKVCLLGTHTSLNIIGCVDHGSLMSCHLWYDNIWVELLLGIDIKFGPLIKVP